MMLLSTSVVLCRSCSAVSLLLHVMLARTCYSWAGTGAVGAHGMYGCV